MLASRQDIIGDLYRLRLEVAKADPASAPDLWQELEVLAAVAVMMGMSHNIVGKARNVERERIDYLLQDHSDGLLDVAAEHGYERHEPTGLVTRNG